MNLDRSLIKSQAKELLKGNVFKFFIIIFVVTLLAQGGTIYSSTVNTVNKTKDTIGSALDNKNSNPNGLDDFDEYDFDNYGSIEDFDIEDFDSYLEEFENQQEKAENKPDVKKNIIRGGLGAFSSISSIIMLFLAPLAITLAGVFYQLIKGNNLGWSEEFSYVFGKTFDKNYWNKFLLNLLQSLFTVLLLCLFIIPGIVYVYKIYFTAFIMAEKPELSWKEAIHISKKMTDGHKGELFVLDLSFIGWFFLTAITGGLVGIYVLPYVYTTRALYYENFKIRAFQLGVMSEVDFLTENEKAAMAYGNVQQGGYYQPPQQNYYQPAQTFEPVQSAEENAYQAPVYQPPQENNYQPPVQNSYQPIDYTYQKADNPTDTVSQPPVNEE